MTFAFGSAKTAYEKNLHPRLLTDAAGLKRLKWQVRKGPGRALLAAVRRKIAGPAREILECANLP
ncbi:MAG: hypothetical protein HY343_00565, partial [Lentisphaerae bacterium]|nr:hypothetical protein [Lentisphaerota bacterium]